MFNFHHPEALPPRQDVRVQPSADELTLDSVTVAKAVTTDFGKTVLKSAVVGALFDLPDGQYPGQRKMIEADVEGAGTCVASAAALAKVRRLGMSGETPSNAASNITLDADGEFVVLEWDGATFWNVVYANATLAFA